MSRSDTTATAERDEHDGGESGAAIIPEGVRFDALFIALSVILMVGLALDFRVHAAGVNFAEEGFWTDPHLLVYSGGAGIAALLGSTILSRQRGGVRWAKAVPTGYGVGVAGLLLFGAAGAADFVWHTAISHEDTALEGLTSPPHLGLAIGGSLFLSSPLRAAWRREGDQNGRTLIPALLSLSFVLSIAVVFGAYVNPLTATQILSDQYLGQNMGLSAMVVFPVVILGASLALFRRFELPPGALTATFLIPGAISIGTNGLVELLIPLLAATVLADTLIIVAPPRFDRPRSLRLFGVLVPVAFASVYFLVVAFWHGLAPVWTTHLWTGGVIVAGVSGLLFTYALLPDGRQSVESPSRNY